MRKIIALVFFCLLAAFTFSHAQQQITTFILLRHAEKGDDGTKDPDLSAAGKQRAQQLATFLKEEKLDAILTTNFKRTRNTVMPLAESKGLVLVNYESLKAEELRALAVKYKSGTILISGHSNTTPAIANVLTGSDRFTPWADSEYDNILIVSVVEVGKEAKVVRLKY